MKRIFQLVLIIILIAHHLSFGQTKQTNAARKGLQSFLKKLPEESTIMYGFDKHDSLECAYLGKPFNLYTIAPSKISHFKTGDSVSSIISKTNLWYFPVMLNHKIKSILVVDKLNNKWLAVSLGYTNLAMEIVKIRQQWPESKGFNLKIIVVFQANKYLFTIPEIDGYNLTLIDYPNEKERQKLSHKISSNKNDLNNFNYSTLDEISKIVEILKPLVEKNIYE